MRELRTKIKLDKSVMNSPNLCDRFDDVDLATISECAHTGFELDNQSRSKWARRMSAAMDLALQMTKGKDFPWPDCSNVAFPLVTIATMQFHARAYPALVSGGEIVSYKVNGLDDDGAEKERAIRVSQHMSWQVLEEDEDWEEQHDRLLINLPIVGCAFKKTYRDTVEDHNDSELVMAKDFVLDYYAKSVEGCSRKTHIIPMARNELWTKMASGAYRDCRDDPWFTQNAVPFTHPTDPEVDRRSGVSVPQSDESTPFTILEQHCWMDLDGDGYAEPYIVCLEYTSCEVLRIVARWDQESDIQRDRKGNILCIKSTEYFTKYTMIPSPDGGIYDLGLGVLLGPLNESVNSLINQLIDSGTMSIAAGGFIGKGAKLRAGNERFAPFEWKKIESSGDDIRKNLFPLPVREPSAVLFNLLNLLINYTDRITGSTDIMVGENPGQNTPAETSRNMLEMGGKVYSAILKRLWRAMRGEFRKLYTLNAIFLPTTSPFGPDGTRILREDYLGDPRRIQPAADPNTHTASARMQQAITIKQAAAATPGYDPEAVERNFLRSLQIENINGLYPGLAKFPPGKGEKITLKEMDLQLKSMELKQAQQQFILDLMEEQRKNSAQITMLEAQAVKFRADAGAAVGNQQIAMFDSMIGALKAHDESLRHRIEIVMNGKANAKPSPDGGGVPAVAPPSGNEVPTSPLDAMGGSPQDVMGGGPLQP
jgi:chaperonin GroES